MNRCIFIFLMLLFNLNTWANDGIYFVSGNQLVPLHETDISVQKEILTISIMDDGFANVDVYYEFFNNGLMKNVLMGFEADAPYNAGEKLNHQGIHADIFGFSVEFNDKKINFSNTVVKSTSTFNDSFVKLNLNNWKQCYEDKKAEEVLPTDQMLYNASLDSMVNFSYLYYFPASFKPGVNIVKHSYRYRMSYNIAYTFNIPYKLTPATRWANKRIDDFTLVIRADNTAKNFLINENVFKEGKFIVSSGIGKIRNNQNMWDEKYIEVTLRNGEIRWHKLNFCPKEELKIFSADARFNNYEDRKSFNYAQFYDRGENYPSGVYQMVKKKASDKRIIRNLPFASRGYVFHDKSLKKLFEKQWWYMPDSNYKPSTADFTQKELEYIKNK